MPARFTRNWRAKLAVLAASTILTGLSAAPSFAGGSDNSGTPATQTPIKHVVVIFGENISFDHYFGTYPFAENLKTESRFIASDDAPGANTLTSAGLLTNNPNLRQPYRLKRIEAYTCDMDHDYTDEQKAVDGGLLDKFVQATGDIGVGCRSDGSTVMAYFDGSTTTALWNYAQRFSMNDNSFGSMFGPSTVGALNLVSGQTGNAVIALTFANGKIATSSPLVSVTGDPDPALDDCGADAGGTKTGKGTVQLSGKNIGDLLNAKGITWGWFQGGFAPTQAATATTPAACGLQHIQHQWTPPGASKPALVVPNPTPENGGPSEIHTPTADYVPHHEPFQYYPSTRNPHHLRPSPDKPSQIGKSDQANHQYDIDDFFSALKRGNLPSVSYLKAPKYQNAHPGNSDPLTEQTFLVTVLNALQQSPFWRQTAVILNYDDSDGWYDHVNGPIVNTSTNLNIANGGDNGSTNANDSFIPTLPLSTSTTPANADKITTSGVCGPTPVGAPPGAGRCGYGPRLPFLVISPWAKPDFIDHSITDQTSSLQFIEANWSLGTIDGTTLPPGAPLGSNSFDQFAGTILNMFDFNNRPNTTPLILDPVTGNPVKHN